MSDRIHESGFENVFLIFSVYLKERKKIIDKQFQIIDAFLINPINMLEYSTSLFLNSRSLF